MDPRNQINEDTEVEEKERREPVEITCPNVILLFVIILFHKFVILYHHSFWQF